MPVRRVFKLNGLEGFEFVNAAPGVSALQLITRGVPMLGSGSVVPMQLVPGRRSDFLAGTNIIVRDRVAERWREALGDLVEFLPLDLQGERIWLVNTLHHVDALDAERSISVRFRSDVPSQVLFLQGPAFRVDRLDDAPIFKLSDALGGGPTFLSGAFVEMTARGASTGSTPT